MTVLGVQVSGFKVGSSVYGLGFRGFGVQCPGFGV